MCNKFIPYFSHDGKGVFWGYVNVNILTKITYTKDFAVIGYVDSSDVYWLSSKLENEISAQIKMILIIESIGEDG